MKTEKPIKNLNVESAKQYLDELINSVEENRKVGDDFKTVAEFDDTKTNALISLDLDKQTGDFRIVLRKYESTEIENAPANFSLNLFADLLFSAYEDGKLSGHEEDLENFLANINELDHLVRNRKIN